MNQPTATRTPLESKSGYLDMLPLALTSTLLVIVSLNLYIFWAKSRVREYLWRTTEVGGSRLYYSGDGAELARGFVLTAGIFLAVFGFPGIVLINAVDVDPAALDLPDLGLLVSLIIGAVVPVVISSLSLLVWIAPEMETTPLGTAASAVFLWTGIVFFVSLSRFLTYRYLFRHSHWPERGGPSGDVPGSPSRYAVRMLLPELSTGLTLGWSAPWRYVKRFELLLDGSTFAGHAVSFQGTSRVLYPRFATCWFIIAGLVGTLSYIGNQLDSESNWFTLQATLLGVSFYISLVLTLGCYNARVFSVIADSIVLEGVGLRFQPRPMELIGLYFTNLTMNLLSAGLSYYYSRMRIARFITRHLVIEGSLQHRGLPGPDRERKELLAEGAEILLSGSYF
ncbi:MAG: DUF898 family protein [Pseudomonadales bacterium]